VATGLAKTYKDAYEISLEGYYKEMSNLIEYEDGSSFLHIEEDWQNKVVSNGYGESYGAEVLLQKKTGVVTGWIGYTLSWTNRQFEDLNFGKKYPYKYDNRHDLNIALSHSWNDRMDFSMVWVFTSGNAITLPVALYDGTPDPNNQYNYYNEEIAYYDGRNGYRMPKYHRLDLSFS